MQKPGFSDQVRKKLGTYQYGILDVGEVYNHYTEHRNSHNGVFINFSRDSELSLWQVLFLIDKFKFTYDDFYYVEGRRKVSLGSCYLDIFRVQRGKIFFRWKNN